MSNKKSATNNIIESLEITKNQREKKNTAITSITTNHKILKKQKYQISSNQKWIIDWKIERKKEIKRETDEPERWFCACIVGRRGLIRKLKGKKRLWTLWFSLFRSLRVYISLCVGFGLFEGMVGWVLDFY